MYVCFRNNTITIQRAYYILLQLTEKIMSLLYRAYTLTMLINQIKSNQIYFSTTFNMAYMCTYLQFRLLYIVNAQCGHLIAMWLSS